MRELDLEKSLGSLSGADPSDDFVDRLREQLDAVLVENGDRAVANETDATFGASDRNTSEHASLIWPEALVVEPALALATSRRRLQHLALAAVAVVVAVFGFYAIDRDEPDGVQVAADRSSETATELLSLAEEDGTSSEQRLGLIVEALSADSSPETFQLLGEQLTDSGLLVQDRLDEPGALSASLSADGRWVSYTNEGRQKIWDVRDGGVREIEDFGQIASAPYSFSVEGGLIAVGQNTVPLLDPGTLQIVEDPIRGLSVPGGSFAISGSQDLVVFDAMTGEVVASSQFPFSIVLGIRASVDAELVVAGIPATSEGPSHLVVWDRLSNSFVEEHPLASAGATNGHQVSFSSNGQAVAVGVNQSVKILDARDFSVVRSIDLAETGFAIEQLSFSEVGETLVVVLTDGDTRQVGVWSVPTGAPLLEPISIAESASRFVWPIEPQNGQIVVPSADGSGLEILVVDPARWIEIACGASEDPLTAEQRLTLEIPDAACNYE